MLRYWNWVNLTIELMGMNGFDRHRKYPASQQPQGDSRSKLTGYAQSTIKNFTPRGGINPSSGNKLVQPLPNSRQYVHQSR